MISLFNKNKMIKKTSYNYFPIPKNRLLMKKIANFMIFIKQKKYQSGTISGLGLVYQIGTLSCALLWVKQK